MMWCKICGGQIYPESETVNGSHADVNHCVVILNAGIDAWQKRAEVAEKRVTELELRITEIDKITEIQCSDGNWNYDPYMHGMANALLLAQAIMNNPAGEYVEGHYVPLERPVKWLGDRVEDGDGDNE